MRLKLLLHMLYVSLYFTCFGLCAPSDLRVPKFKNENIPNRVGARVSHARSPGSKIEGGAHFNMLILHMPNPESESPA